MPPVPLGNRTKMESTAALFPKQGSRAMGFGTDCRKKRNILHIGSCSNPGEHTPLSKTRITEALLLLLVFVSATCTANTKQLPIPRGAAHSDLLAQIGPPPQNPPLLTISRQWCLCAAWDTTGYQVGMLGERICVSGAAGCPTHRTH